MAGGFWFLFGVVVGGAIAIVSFWLDTWSRR